MNFNIDIYFEKIDYNMNLKKLNDLFLEQSYKENKVAYYYEDSKGNVISYNKDICFYSASTIKVLLALLLLEKALDGKIDLKDKILITKKDLKQDTGIIKYQKQDTYYSILDLIRLSITESDNTAYLKLVSFVGKNAIKEYGNSIGAKHTFEGRDCFGNTSCSDLIIYWKKIKKFIDSKNIYSDVFKNYLLNPTFKIIEDESINNELFFRKYGSYDIAYHEAGYIDSKNPYYLFILTQLNKFEYKKDFINHAAKLISSINETLKEDNHYIKIK